MNKIFILGAIAAGLYFFVFKKKEPADGEPYDIEFYPPSQATHADHRGSVAR